MDRIEHQTAQVDNAVMKGVEMSKYTGSMFIENGPGAEDISRRMYHAHSKYSHSIWSVSVVYESVGILA